MFSRSINVILALVDIHSPWLKVEETPVSAGGNRSIHYGNNRPFSVVKSRAAIMAAIHCARPPLMFSFLAPTTMRTGALTNNCSGDWDTMKSHTPFNPWLESTEKSIPENRLT